MAVIEREDELEVASEQDLRLAVKRALDDIGMTFDQLAAEAEAGHFSSEQARMTWMALRDLADLA
jgi:hypothetical protein